MRWIGCAMLLALMGCPPLEPIFCRPCSGGDCGPHLSCEQGICVQPRAPERCPNYVPPDPAKCGEEPACEDGYECFEDRCQEPVEVAVGHRHSCVRWPSGHVSCWGDNSYGKSSGEGSPLPSPRLVEGLDDAVALSLGEHFSCALRENGKVACWGRDNEGQLGDLTRDESPEDFLRDSRTPVEVDFPEDKRAVRIGGGSAHTCVVTDQGELYCWGRGGKSDDGEACLMGVPDSKAVPGPLLITEDGDYEALDGSAYASVFLRDGRTFGLGWGGTSQILGDERIQEVCELTDLGLDDVSMLAVGHRHACFLIGDRQVQCTQNAAPYTPVGPFHEPVAQLEVGLMNSCIRLASGQLSCWGAAQNGVLGPQVEPLQTSTSAIWIPDSKGATDFDVGEFHIVMLKPGEGVFTWGADRFGVLGLGQPFARRPTRVVDGDFVDVAAGQHHACGLRSDGRVLCWGSNLQGQLGLGTLTTFEPPTLVPGLMASSISAGVDHTCAMDMAGQPFCWGDNAYGAVSGAGAAVPSPRRVEGLPPIQTLDAAWHSGCALSEVGELWCWGWNDDQAIIGTAPRYIRTATRMELSGVRAIAAARDYHCGLVGTRLSCRGIVTFFDEDTELGEGAEEITSGIDHVCARYTDGHIECAGRNKDGQLGNGTFSDTPILQRVQGVQGATQVHSMFGHTCVIFDQGQVRCWGRGEGVGLLGQGAQEIDPWPVTVDVPPARNIELGRNFSCAATAQGVWCWGKNEEGEVTGQDLRSLTPQRVKGLFGARLTSP